MSAKGFAELGQALRALGVEIGTKAAFKGVLAGANVIKKRAQALAPIAPEPYTVDDGSKGGQLVQPENIARNIVTKKVGNTSHTAEYVVAVRGKRKDGYANRIAILQEFGTVKTPAQPFMRPAFEQEKGFAVAAIADALGKAIAKANKS